ncbi:MAG: hypothetical protein Q8N99_05810 [Nanoarchaeota archaeon]|nr:hypothetical protein [Nanoarchaeota archaeon]
MANKREFPRDMSFIDRQGNVVHPSRKDYNARKSAKVGKAYAFFDCDASKQQIETSKPQIRSKAKTPKGLQMLLNEGISGLQLDEKLAEQIQYPDDYRTMSSERIKQGYEEERRPLASMKYVLVANYEGASNKDAANELGDVMNVIHRMFNEDQGIFRGAVVYEKNGEYQLRE